MIPLSDFAEWTGLASKVVRKILDWKKVPKKLIMNLVCYDEVLAENVFREFGPHEGEVLQTDILREHELSDSELELALETGLLKPSRICGEVVFFDLPAVRSIAADAEFLVRERARARMRAVWAENKTRRRVKNYVR